MNPGKGLLHLQRNILAKKEIHKADSDDQSNEQCQSIEV